MRSRPRSRITVSLRPALAATLVAAVVGCGEQPTSPTAAEPTADLATAAATALVFAQLSGGWDQTCGLTSDHRAWCWGYNGQGQVGDGTTTQRTLPVPVAGNLLFRQISVGGLSVCAVTTTDQAYCWGYNGIGELGDGTRTDRHTPVRVLGNHKFRQIETNFGHTCAVTTDNRAFCWGDNREGQLGTGSRTGPEVGPYTGYSTRPVAVIGSHAFRQVTAGYEFTCGVTTSSAAFCWGLNGPGAARQWKDLLQLLPARGGRGAGAHPGDRRLLARLCRGPVE